ncbi:MAG: hypothetical protein ABFD54_07355 [Armatimonadota bacterium]|nr:hypothetical protein [bacterium]
MIRHNLFYKLLAFGVAMGLWFYVNAERNPHSRRVFTVPLVVTNSTRGYVTELGQDEATITVEGLKAAVDSVQRVSAVVDLNGFNSRRLSAEKLFNVRASVSGVPQDELNDLSVTVNPGKVRVKIEAMTGKRLPVEVKFPSAPPLGYAYGNPGLNPGSISISGKSTNVSQVRRIILTLPDRIQGGSLDDYFDVKALDGTGNHVSGVELSPMKVRVKLDLVEVPATKTVIVSPNVSGEPRYPARVTKVLVAPSSVTLEGRPSSLANLSTVTTDPIVVAEESGNITKDVNLHVPTGVKISGDGKVRVTVYVSVPD